MTKPLRILHVLRAPVGGLFRHVRDLAREQAARGCAVGVICDANTYDSLTEQRLAELQPSLALGLLKVPMSRDLGPADVSATRAVAAFARVAHVHILHGHGAKGGAYARFAARSVRNRGGACHAFYTPHGGSLHYDPSSLIGRAYFVAERHMARMTSGLVFESAFSARTFREKVGEPACPTRVVHNGISPAELVPVTADTSAADLLFIGELRKLKGVDVLLDALKLVHARRPCRLAIVGTGPDEQTFRAQATALGLSDHVRFAGAMPAREAFRLGRILVMPSRAESFPYVVLEGAGAGLPFVATNVGGLPEIIDGTDTPLVAPDNANDLSQALIAALEQPEETSARAARMHNQIARRFSIKAMADGVQDFYGVAHVEQAVARMPIVAWHSA